MRRSVGITIMSIVSVLFMYHESISAQTYDSALTPYVDFLKTQNISAIDYILNLFTTNDIVVLCERDHRDTTQYDLYLSVIKNKRFIEEVGNVFTEIGVSSLTTRINSFLHTDDLRQDMVNKTVLGLHRDCEWSPLWEQENFSYLLRGLYDINRNLPPDLKINLYPSDVPFDWSRSDTSSYRVFRNTLDSFRDSIMATQIIHVFDSLHTSRAIRKKALIIMNYRHAFGHKFEFPLGKAPNNVGRFLFQKYDNHIANVYVNFLRLVIKPSETEPTLDLIHHGKWDAAFKALSKEDVGFDFKDSPFGRDQFDIWPWENPFTFSDVFTGFVFWLPLEKHCNVSGIPNFVDSLFANEILRRFTIFNTVLGRNTALTIDGLRRDCNIQRISQVGGLDSLIAARNRWFH